MNKLHKGLIASTLVEVFLAIRAAIPSLEMPGIDWEMLEYWKGRRHILKRLGGGGLEGEQEDMDIQEGSLWVLQH